MSPTAAQVNSAASILFSASSQFLAHRECWLQIGVVQFGDSAVLQFHLNHYHDKASVIGALRNIPWLDAQTNTSGGIWYMREQMFTRIHGDRPDAPDIGIVITDGASNLDYQLTIPYARQAHAQGIKMFAIGIGPGVNQAVC